MDMLEESLHFLSTATRTFTETHCCFLWWGAQVAQGGVAVEAAQFSWLLAVALHYQGASMQLPGRAPGPGVQARFTLLRRSSKEQGSCTPTAKATPLSVLGVAAVSG